MAERHLLIRTRVVEDTKTMTVGEDAMPQAVSAACANHDDRRRLQFVLRAQTAPTLHVTTQRAARIDPAVTLRND